MDCVIVGAGVGGAVLYRPGADAFVIAADGGLRLCRELGLTPNLIIGDFDSLGTVPQGSEVITLPVEKDMTDMAAALELGIGRGYRRFVLLGGTGGRPDHTVANYQLLGRLAREGLQGYLVGDGFTATAISDGTALRFSAARRGTVSVFAQGGEARGVGERGLYYGLADATLLPTEPMGVSNSFTGREAEIAVREGTLLVLYEGTDENFPLTIPLRDATMGATKQN